MVKKKKSWFLEWIIVLIKAAKNGDFNACIGMFYLLAFSWLIILLLILYYVGNFFGYVFYKILDRLGVFKND